MTYIGSGSLVINADQITFKPNNFDVGSSGEQTIKMDGALILNPYTFNAGTGTSSDIGTPSGSVIFLELGRIDGSGSPLKMHTIGLGPGKFVGHTLHIGVTQPTSGTSGPAAGNAPDTIFFQISGNFAGGKSAQGGGSALFANVDGRQFSMGCIWGTDNKWHMLYRSETASDGVDLDGG